MRTTILTATVVALLATSASAQKSDPGVTRPGHSESQDKPSPDQAEWARIGALLQNGDMPGAATALDRQTALPAFKDYPADFQIQVQRLRLALALELGKYPDALIIARRLTIMDGVTAQDWTFRISAASGVQDWGDAARSLIALTAFGSGAVDKLESHFVNGLAGRYVLQTPNGNITQARLVDALYNSGWNKDASSLWANRAASLLGAGDTTRAALMLRKVTSVSARLSVSVDRRFDALRSVVPEAFDVDAAIANELEEGRTKASAVNASLEDSYRYALLLLQRARFDEALSTVDAALVRAETTAAGTGASPVDPDQLIWALDTRSRALVFLGRHDEAIAALRRAARRPEHGSLNVSHAINLGDLYNRIDRPEEALDAVSDIEDGNVSAFGLMQMKEVQACAYAAMGRSRELKLVVDWVKQHEADAPGGTANVAICAGDEQTAAAALIARLDDPIQRMGALVDIQDYIDPPHLTASDRQKRAIGEAVLTRADVVAAIARAGYRRSWALMGPQF